MSIFLHKYDVRKTIVNTQWYDSPAHLHARRMSALRGFLRKCIIVCMEIYPHLGCVVSALPGALPSSWGGAGTGIGVSAFAMVICSASEASSPQWGQKITPFRGETQALWKRWFILKSGWHSKNVPCRRQICEYILYITHFPGRGGHIHY